MRADSLPEPTTPCSLAITYVCVYAHRCPTPSPCYFDRHLGRLGYPGLSRQCHGQVRGLSRQDRLAPAAALSRLPHLEGADLEVRQGCHHREWGILAVGVGVRASTLLRLRAQHMPAHLAAQSNSLQAPALLFRPTCTPTFNTQAPALLFWPPCNPTFNTHTHIPFMLHEDLRAFHSSVLSACLSNPLSAQDQLPAITATLKEAKDEKSWLGKKKVHCVPERLSPLFSVLHS